MASRSLGATWWRLRGDLRAAQNASPGRGRRTMAVDYRLLGRLEVIRDGVPVELGAFRQRALLALLLANAGTVLSTDRILDELWGETFGADKQGSLWVYVSGLRGALEPGRTKRSEGTILLTRAPGYVLAIDRDDTDLGRFERTLGEARV